MNVWYPEWLSFHKIVEKWWIWVICGAVICILCPFLIPAFGVVLIAGGIYAWKKKSRTSVIALLLILGVICIAITVVGAIEWSTMHYSITGTISNRY